MATVVSSLSIPAGLLALLCLLLPEISLAQSHDGWIDSRPFLIEGPRPVAPHDFLLVKSLYGAMTRSLLNPEQHRQLADLQARTGTRPLDTKLHSLSIYKLTATQTTAVPTDITKSMSSFLGREFKTTAMPDALRSGFSFELGSKAVNGPATPAPVRYGLIVTNLEPNPESFRIASVSGSGMEDYALVSYAPKAQVKYKVGPLLQEQDIASSDLGLATSSASNWSSGLPDWNFRGKIAARGAPTASQILPPQSLLLEQTQGFYTLEIQTSQLLHKDAIFHRTRVPLIGTMNLREERNEKFKKTRSTLENIYASGPLALNLDYFGQEKRYQTGLIYQKSLTRIEFYNHLPQGGAIWKQQRYELKLQTAF